jgi:hypothetical protein
MTNPIQHAKQSEETSYLQIQPYMLSLFQRLAGNYAILGVSVVIVNTIGVQILLGLLAIPQSTATAIAFAVNLLIFFYGWRFLENRNHATALFVLYTQYSRQRRHLKASIAMAENGTLDDENTLYVQVDLLEETAKSFLAAVAEQNLKARPRESAN